MLADKKIAMKKPDKNPRIPRSLQVLGLALALTGVSQLNSSAHPYASGITGTNGAGMVSFIMNEAGATVTITFEDHSITNLGVLPKGMTNFYLGSHTSYQISCFKQGTGLPTLISDDASGYSQWTNGSGFAVNQNPKVGSYFGRLYAANSSAAGGAVPKSVGIYALNADQTFVAFVGTNASGSPWLGGSYSSNFKSPGRIRVAPDNTLLVADGKGVGGANMVYQFSPDLESDWALLGPSTSTGTGDLFGTPVAFCSLANGDHVLYTP